jgi:hypothetical protein
MHSRSIWRAAACLPLIAACTHRVADFNVLGNRALTGPVERGPRVTGRDCVPMVLSLPLGSPSLEEATDRALAADPTADMLVDVVVRTTGWWFGVGQICYVVEGNLARVQRPPTPVIAGPGGA